MASHDSLKLENAVVINFFFKNVSKLFSIKLAFVPTQTQTRKRSGYYIVSKLLSLQNVFALLRKSHANRGKR